MTDALKHIDRIKGPVYRQFALEFTDGSFVDVWLTNPPPAIVSVTVDGPPDSFAAQFKQELLSVDNLVVSGLNFIFADESSFRFAGGFFSVCLTGGHVAPVPK